MGKLAEKLLGNVDWQSLKLDLSPQHEDCYATHKGSFQVNAFKIRCYKASDGMTALDIEDIERFFRGCPNCKNPSECCHCNQVAEDADGQRTAIKLETEL